MLLGRKCHRKLRRAAKQAGQPQMKVSQGLGNHTCLASPKDSFPIVDVLKITIGGLHNRHSTRPLKPMIAQLVQGNGKVRHKLSHGLLHAHRRNIGLCCKLTLWIVWHGYSNGPASEGFALRWTRPTFGRVHIRFRSLAAY